MCFYKSLPRSVVAFAFIAVQMGCTSDENDPGSLNATSGANTGFYSGGMIRTGGEMGQSTASGTMASGTMASGTMASGTMASGTGGTTPGSQCGNGVVEPGAQCEPGVDIITTCLSLGEISGTVACDPTCHFDVSGCTGRTGNAGSSGIAGIAGTNSFTVNYELSSEIGTVGIVTWSTTINPVTEAYIEFGLDTNYGMKAPVDLADPEYRTLLLGMKGSREYHFRVVAKDGTSEYQSEDL